MSWLVAWDGGQRCRLLGNNRFTGSVPSTISALYRLETLCAPPNLILRPHGLPFAVGRSFSFRSVACFRACRILLAPREGFAVVPMCRHRRDACVHRSLANNQFSGPCPALATMTLLTELYAFGPVRCHDSPLVCLRVCVMI